MASVDETDPLQLLDIEEHQSLKDLEDQMVDIILVLETTVDLILTLQGQYMQFNRDSGRKSEKVDDNEDWADAIGIAFQEKQKDAISSRRKVETLLAKVKGTVKLVREIGFANDALSHLTFVAAIEPPRVEEWTFNKVIGRRSEKGEPDHAKAHREEYTGLIRSAGLDYHHFALPTSHGRICEPFGK